MDRMYRIRIFLKSCRSCPSLLIHSYEVRPTRSLTPAILVLSARACARAAGGGRFAFHFGGGDGRGEGDGRGRRGARRGVALARAAGLGALRLFGDDAARLVYALAR